MKKVLTGLAFSAFLFLNQCSNVSEPLSSSTQENKSVKIAIKTRPDFKSIAGRATVNISAPNMNDLTKELQISDSMLSGTISVPIGSNRLFEVFVYSQTSDYDTSASIIYYGSTLSDIGRGLNPVNITLTDNINGLAEITGTIEDTDTFDFPHDTLIPHDTILPNDTILPEQYQVQSKTMSFKLSPSDTQVIDFSDYDSIYFRVSGNWCIKESLCTDAYGFFLDSSYSRTDLVSDIFPAGILLGNIGRGTIMVNDYSLVDTRLLEKRSIVLYCNRFKNGDKNSESGFINVDVFLSKHVKVY